MNNFVWLPKKEGGNISRMLHVLDVWIVQKILKNELGCLNPPPPGNQINQQSPDVNCHLDSDKEIPEQLHQAKLLQKMYISSWELPSPVPAGTWESIDFSAFPKWHILVSWRARTRHVKSRMPPGHLYVVCTRLSR